MSTVVNDATAVAKDAAKIETHRRPWWMSLIIGIASVAVGCIMLFGSMNNKVETYMLVISLLGLWWVIKGVLDIVSMFVDHTAWAWKLFIGIIGILAGAWILMYPVIAGLTLPKVFVLVLGIWALIDGVILLVMAFKGGGWAAGILGILGIVFGLLLIANYSVVGMGLSFVWVASIFLLIGGIIQIVGAFQQRKP